MTTIPDVKKLNVKYNDRTVGTLVHTDGRKIAFQYDDKWIRDGFSISPFSLPLTREIYPGGKDMFGGLYAVQRFVARRLG